VVAANFDIVPGYRKKGVYIEGKEDDKKKKKRDAQTQK